MAKHILPPAYVLWKRHEMLYVDIFSIALAQLAKKKCSFGDEDTISEQLCPVLNSVCFEENKKRKCEIRTPAWEKPIQPVTDNELKGGKVRKRPDFTCKYHNHFATCAEEHEIAFHVECKLLGNPTSASWIINKNYVSEGIKRFDCRIHEYGNRASSGLMIGYIISMEPKQIIIEVNKFQQKQLPHNPALSFHFGALPVFKDNQNLSRKSVNPESFRLIHLWVDFTS